MTFYTDPVYNVNFFFCEATIIFDTKSDIFWRIFLSRDLEVGTSTVSSFCKATLYRVLKELFVS
jgi:hypothetical protein